jgi:hypothetical protein
MESQRLSYPVSFYQILVKYNLTFRLHRCLAHVINLATQALIAGCSKTQFFDLAQPDDHTPDTEDFEHDIVGIIHAITVKVFVSEVFMHSSYADITFNKRFAHPQNTRQSSSPCRVNH